MPNYYQQESSECLNSSRFENKCGLSEDLKFLASMPELCDVTFLVGENKEPVCGVKAILAARSRVFHKMLFMPSSSNTKKRSGTADLKLSMRMFTKRSDSLPNLHLISNNTPKTIIIQEFEADVFRQLIEYIHTGCVTLQARTLLGLMNAADYYGLDDLRRACMGFMRCCINIDNVGALLSSAEKYIQYKATKSIVQRVLEYVDVNGDEVLNLPAFATLPEHVVRLVLSRDELCANELSKFRAAISWATRNCQKNPHITLKESMAVFVEYISFYHIPTLALMREVRSCGAVPDQIIMNALAYQADPSSVDPAKFSSPCRQSAALGNLAPREISPGTNFVETDAVSNKTCSLETLSSMGSDKTEESRGSEDTE
ncbi:serine-enriched protein-like [Saccoglossus kowalevskii]|uniref:Serine-enriched protein-like n=1 Tax=Saccoglossus kowalevskii TaxID=10224 RepID=A0ABM0GYB4_SACKO|nr:PREDICTED: serine-enriched protein-like [Saccoglossus kowalevskii]